ncbi:XRE family transcriptional regulator [Streptomyces inhibens]|uniref:XRE family transcriptional regulator n=1 Tax=Streptomyces inhibens TaxID=2293571 RepID=A0A371PQR5_STRIH|nr:XRE family transcriptional regulator [Streptomyces inhibens]
MPQETSLGLRIRSLRRQRGLSQAALAGRRISNGYLSRLESGTRQPTEREITCRAKQLGADHSTFDAPPSSGSLTQAPSITASTEADEAFEDLANVPLTAQDENPLASPVADRPVLAPAW